jgi:hypothetical protein
LEFSKNQNNLALTFARPHTPQSGLVDTPLGQSAIRRISPLTNQFEGCGDFRAKSGEGETFAASTSISTLWRLPRPTSRDSSRRSRHFSAHVKGELPKKTQQYIFVLAKQIVHWLQTPISIGNCVGDLEN